MSYGSVRQEARITYFVAEIGNQVKNEEREEESSASFPSCNYGDDYLLLNSISSKSSILIIDNSLLNTIRRRGFNH